jgi:hypothetical protein
VERFDGVPRHAGDGNQRLDEIQLRTPRCHDNARPAFAGHGIANNGDRILRGRRAQRVFGWKNANGQLADYEASCIFGHILRVHVWTSHFLQSKGLPNDKPPEQKGASGLIAPSASTAAILPPSMVMRAKFWSAMLASSNFAMAASQRHGLSYRGSHPLRYGEVRFASFGMSDMVTADAEWDRLTYVAERVARLS